MRFITLCRVHGGTIRDRIQRRMDWNLPDDVELVAEYWLPAHDPHVILITEAKSLASILAAQADWDDVFEMNTFPAMTVEEGLELGKKMMAEAKKAKKTAKEPVTV